MWLLLLFYALAASIGTVWLWMRGLQQVPAEFAFPQANCFFLLAQNSERVIRVDPHQQQSDRIGSEVHEADRVIGPRVGRHRPVRQSGQTLGL